MKHPNYAVDLHSVARHIVTQITDAGETPLSVSECARSYSPPNPADLTRVRGIEEIEDTDQAAKEWMIAYVVSQMNKYVRIDDGILGFQPDKDITNTYYDRKVLMASRPETQPWLDAFNPMKNVGTFAENVRFDTGKETKQDEELRESMKSFGWIPHHPAIKDEKGVVLVGHRRVRVARELGLEPDIITIRLGSGSAGDAMRFKLAVASNLGGKPFTDTDRKRLAQKLYQDDGWTIERIAEALSVSVGTTSSDLKDTPKRAGSGGSKTSSGDDPAWQAQADPIVRRYMAGEILRDDAVRIGREVGIDPWSKHMIQKRQAVLEAEDRTQTSRPTSSAAEQDGPPSEPPQTTPEEEQEPTQPEDPPTPPVRLVSETVTCWCGNEHTHNVEEAHG